MQPEEDTYERNPIISTPANKCDSLAIDMFRHVVAQEKEGNVVFSPASVESVLLMLRDGAAGQTRKELDVLPYGKQGVASAMQVESANAIFADASLTLKPIAAEVQQVPFRADVTKAAQRINAWCNKHTHGKLQSVISPLNIPENTGLFAVNAVYLKEKWLRPFKKSSTEHLDFHLRDGSTVKTPMMYEEEELLYATGDDWQAVALFYRTNGRPGEPGCFIGILPQGDARDFAAKLTPAKFNAIRTALTKSSYELAEVYLPRFEAKDHTLNLVPALQALGIKTAFTEQADFSRMAYEPLYLQGAMQKCYVKVDEQGTEAIAITIMPVPVQSAVLLNDTRIIRFDRPFLWVISDLSTDAPPYFMGLVEDVRS